MILTVANIKGGVGKSTLAVNIAVARALAGAKTLLIDGDEQHTALDFTDKRAENLGASGYTAVALLQSSIKTQAPQLARDYDDVIIDAGGRNSESMRAAISVADTLLVPVQPRSFDVWALDQLAEVVTNIQAYRPEEHPLRAYVVLNKAFARGRDNDEAAEYVQSIEGLEYASVVIAQRKAFSDAQATGRSVLEYTPRDPKAIEELQALVHLLYGGA